MTKEEFKKIKDTFPAICAYPFDTPEWNIYIRKLATWAYTNVPALLDYCTSCMTETTEVGVGDRPNAVMKSESKWFRPPQFLRMGHCGDAQQFLWIAEPEKGEGVYGVGFLIAESLTWGTFDIDRLYNMIRDAALKELHARIERGEKHGEGCAFEIFLWNPVFYRHKDGQMQIKEAGID